MNEPTPSSVARKMPDLPRGLRNIFLNTDYGVQRIPITDPLKQPTGMYDSPAYNAGLKLRELVQSGFGGKKITDIPRLGEAGIGAIGGLGVAGLRNMFSGGGHNPLTHAIGGGLAGWLLGGLTKRASLIPGAMSPSQLADIVAQIQNIPANTRTQMIEATYRMTPVQLATASRLAGAVTGAGAGAALLQYYTQQGLLAAAVGALFGAAIGMGVGHQLSTPPFQFAIKPNFGYSHTVSPHLRGIIFGQ